MASVNKSILSSECSTKKLFDSIRGGEDVGTTQALLQECVDIDAGDSEGYTPLLLACLHERIKIVDLLIKFGANVDVKCNSSEYTVLHYASQNGWIDLVRTLVKKVPDLNAGAVTGETALHRASRFRFLNVVKCLVEEGADIHKINIDGNTALHFASCFGYLEIVKYLVEKGANITTRNSRGETALFYAAMLGRFETVEYLVEIGSDIDTQSFLHSALHVASCLGRLAVVKFLVEKGADINIKDCKGTTPVLRAAQNKRKAVFDLLIQSGVKVDTTNELKCTLLHYASIHGWIEIVQSNINKICDLDAKGIYGVTALGLACRLRKLDIAQCLLQAGASWDIEDKGGNSPLNYVTRVKEPEFKLVKLLIENGAYLKRVDYEALVKSSSQKVLQDVELCCQAIANKFNNFDLPELYKLPASGNLPRIEEMKIARGSEVAQSIKRTVVFEIQTKKHCNILEVRPMALSIFSVRSVLEYSEKKNIRIAKWVETASRIC